MNNTLNYSPETFRELAKRLVHARKPPSRRNDTVGTRVFRAHFGICWDGCADVWNPLVMVMMEKDKESLKNMKAEYLLWMLLHLHVYPNEHIMESMIGKTAKTIREKIRLMMYGMNMLSVELVSLCVAKWNNKNLE